MDAVRVGRGHEAAPLPYVEAAYRVVRHGTVAGANLRPAPGEAQALLVDAPAALTRSTLRR